MKASESYTLIRASSGEAVAHLKRASNWWSKGVGLLGQQELAAGAGLWLPGIDSVHTVFMQFPIDLVFLDKNLEVLQVNRSVRPGVLNVGRRGAHHTLELGSGTLEHNSLQLGERCFLRNEQGQPIV